MNSIILTGGGTAGHCIPHLALLPYIHNSFDNICYIGSNGMEKQIMSGLCDYYEIPVVKFRRSFCLENILIPFKLFNSIIKAKEILKKLKPKVVFSKGGYVALPVVIAAQNLKIPVICHESDYTLGLANKLTAKKCDKVLTTFSDTALSLPNGLHTGSPIREQLFYADKTTSLNKFRFSKSKPTVLIFGGSLGSKNLNNALENCLVELLKSFNVIHVCGKGNLRNKKNLNGYCCLEYASDMASCYKACDFCVSRGGSNSLSEIIALKIPSLIIPLGKSQSRGDQILNAAYYKNKGLCLTISDDELNAKTLITNILALQKQSNQFKAKLNQQKNVIGNLKIAEILNSYSTL